MAVRMLANGNPRRPEESHAKGITQPAFTISGFSPLDLNASHSEEGAMNVP
jgi:hypothetical protein